jgi:hypothetical protein
MDLVGLVNAGCRYTPSKGGQAPKEIPTYHYLIASIELKLSIALMVAQYP